MRIECINTYKVLIQAWDKMVFNKSVLFTNSYHYYYNKHVEHNEIILCWSCQVKMYAMSYVRYSNVKGLRKHVLLVKIESSKVV